MAELFEVTFAIWTGAVGVHHATNRGEIAWLVLGNGGTDFCYTADDFMAGNYWIVRRHEFAPFVADKMEVGVADATEKNFDLHVPVRWIASRNCCRSQ